jgi:hypothetical protein
MERWIVGTIDPLRVVVDGAWLLIVVGMIFGLVFISKLK